VLPRTGSANISALPEGHDGYFSGMGKEQVKMVRAALEKRNGQGALK
jgi:hypothetical protein